jgi:pilus assembly protein CpaF
MKEKIRQQVMEQLDFSKPITDRALKEVIQEEINKESREVPMLLDEKIRLNKEVFYALRRLDILQDLLEDDEVTEIMINGYHHIFIECRGKLYRYPGKFSGEEKLYQVIQQVAAGANRMVNEMNPIVDARLSDGSRVNIILPPVSIDGAVMTIRKFAKEPMTMEWLRKHRAFSDQIGEFLKILVRARYNIFISGGTGSGKTTLLNGLSNCIPKDERIITIEDSAELRLNGIENLVRLEMRNANAAGEHKVDMKDLIKAALRSRPDRIIVGEVRGEEALSMLNAMNTGHDGSISTGHGNNSADMLKRIETMVLMGVDMPVSAIRGQMASAIDMIVHLGRLPDGSRRLMEIVEIMGLKQGEIQVHPLFVLDEQGVMKQQGELKDTKKLKEYGQYEDYQKLMEKIRAGSQIMER